ncbi:MAG: phage portal protein [Clostridia bacterium]|nr:phage portal protein [Clostridia bacterium]
MDFVLDAIREHQQSVEYKIAADAELYDAHRNPTIMRYQKFVYNQMGQKVPDIWAANNKIASNWYNYFTTQAVQYLLGNGVTFGKDDTKKKLGKKFDRAVQDAAGKAKNGGVSFGFWNLDHVEVFGLTEFVPLRDEEDGSHKAGIRHWQIEDDKPLRATLYELDGYTDYIKRKGEDMQILHPKRSYKYKVAVSEADGETILDGENYGSFPIVPFWNINRQSELVGNQGTLDAYDLMISGLVNNVSDGEFIYWILKNCGGMTELDDAKFIEQMKLTRVAHADGDDGAEVEAHKVEVPFEASAEALDRLEKQLYKDFMALKVDDISAGATNDQIQAAYEPINQKTDAFEYCVTDFIERILELAGIEDTPTYTRSQLSNRTEVAEMLLQAAEHLDDEYIVTKLLTLLGDADKVDEVLKRKDAEAADRYKQNEENQNNESEDE